MQTKTFQVTNEGGLHARPAAVLVSLAKGFKSQLTISCGENSAPLKNPIGLLSLGISQGSAVAVTADGQDEEAALERIGLFFEEELKSL